MRKLSAVNSDEPTILIFCTLEWSPTQFVLPCCQWLHDGLKIFFQYLLLLEQKFGWAFPPSPCLFLYVLQLEWSLNTSFDKKNQMHYELVFHFNKWFKFSSAKFCFLTKYTKEKKKDWPGKKLNVDRQFFNEVICIFLWHFV